VALPRPGRVGKGPGQCRAGQGYMICLGHQALSASLPSEARTPADSALEKAEDSSEAGVEGSGASQGGSGPLPEARPFPGVFPRSHRLHVWLGGPGRRLRGPGSGCAPEPALGANLVTGPAAFRRPSSIGLSRQPRAWAKGIEERAACEGTAFRGIRGSRGAGSGEEPGPVRDRCRPQQSFCARCCALSCAAPGCPGRASHPCTCCEPAPWCFDERLQCMVPTCSRSSQQRSPRPLRPRASAARRPTARPPSVGLRRPGHPHARPQPGADLLRLRRQRLPRVHLPLALPPPQSQDPSVRLGLRGQPTPSLARAALRFWRSFHGPGSRPAHQRARGMNRGAAARGAAA